MNIEELLTSGRDEILEDTAQRLHRARLVHYEQCGDERTRALLELLFGLVTASVRGRNTTDLLRYARSIARDRHAAGFDLVEVQTAFNVLGEAVWMRIRSELPAEEAVEALGLFSTVLGMGKDEIARCFVGLSNGSTSPALGCA